MKLDEFAVDCTGDVVTGDIISFTEGVFAGSYRKPKYVGSREVVAEVVNDSYGERKQQHTFTLKILRSSGTRPLEVGTKTTRKGRNVYRNGTCRLPWTDERERKKSVDEKHQRGNMAREMRAIRKGTC